MSNNPALYNAAFSGSSAGMSSRSLTIAAAPFFAQTANACTAFALALDTALGVVSNVTQADCDLLQAICSSYWQNRVPTFQTEAEYSNIAGPLADYFIAMRAALEAGGVAEIGSDLVINQSSVPGENVSSALDTLANGFDDYAFIVSMFGTNGFRAFTHEQASASNDEAPALILTPPVEVNKFTIGPDDRVYAGSSAFQGVAAYHMPLRSGSMIRYKVAHIGSGPSGVTFFNQAPATGVNPWTMWCPVGVSGHRVNAGLNLASTPEFATLQTFTIANSGMTDACFDGAGNLWYTGASGGATVRINVNGAPGVVVNDVTFAGSNWPGSGQGIAIDGSGNMYRTNYAVGAGTIRRCNAATIAAAVGAGPLNQVPDFIYTVNGLAGIEIIFFDHSGNLWGITYDTPAIFRINAADLGSSGAKTPDIVLTGGGTLGNGGATGPVVVRPFRTFGPLR